MKQIAVTIPDNKVRLFKELMESLSFVENIETIDCTNIPEWHKSIIDQRMENYRKNPDNYDDWDEVQKELAQKYGL
jgi:hypothetical protein